MNEVRIMEDKLVIECPGYQDVTIERQGNASYFLYVGDDFVVFTPREWEEFKTKIAKF